jgi:hypothetical protein
VPDCRFDADLGRHARNDKGMYSTVAQNHVQRCTLKRGHGNSVKDRFARERGQLRNNLKFRRVAEEAWLDFVD